MSKTVLITGASRGIGAAAAKLFAKNGYAVAVNYCRSEDAANRLCSELRTNGAWAEAYRANVSSSADVLHMFTQISNHFGSIDVLVNNAGIAAQKLFSDITEAEWDSVFDVNIKGMFNCCKAVLPGMIHKKSGRIINISSIWGICGASCEVHYSASKAAVIGFTKALAKETGPSGITVNCIAPGIIDTEMNGALTETDRHDLMEETPLGRFGTPEEVAKSILFLAGDDAGFITGQVISPNGGFVI